MGVNVRGGGAIVGVIGLHLRGGGTMGLHLKGRWGCKRHHESPFQGEGCYRGHHGSFKVGGL